MQQIRVLIAKPGLDGHDRGALVIAQGLRDQGMEVIYTGLRQTPEQIVETAIQEDVACIGLSSLSGAHMELFPEVVRLLRERQADDILVIGGGVIPEADIPALQAAGIAMVFTPGTRIEDVASFIRAHVKLRDLADAPPVEPVAKQVDHIGIAVRSIAEALPFYTRHLGLTVDHDEIIPDQKVRAVFVRAGDLHLELLEPTSPDSPIAQFLDKRGPGLHHVAYRVEDIDRALSALKEAGVRLIDEQPRPGGLGKRIAFIHPKEAHGVLTEYCQRVGEAAE